MNNYLLLMLFMIVAKEPHPSEVLSLVRAMDWSSYGKGLQLTGNVLSVLYTNATWMWLCCQ